MAKQSQAWKALERKIAKLIGGKRMGRGKDFSQELPDCLSENFVVEAKYRTKGLEFLYSMLKQAESYKTGKIPLGVFKNRSARDEIVIMKLSDFAELFKKLILIEDL